MRTLFCAIYMQIMLRKKNIAKKEGYSCAQNIANYLRIVLDYCLLGYYLLNYYCSKHITLNVFKLLLVYVCKVIHFYTITTEQHNINNNI